MTIMPNSLYTIESAQLRVQVAARGAELQSVMDRSNEQEYLWQGDPAFWAKRSPVLFPIVGTLRENRYQYEGNWYEMGRHGFARDRDFELEVRQPDRLQWLLRDDEATRLVYPFSFEFRIDYQVAGATLTVSYEVRNPGTGPLLFSAGGHPAFRVPVVANSNYDDYELYFEKMESSGRWPISPDGLIMQDPEPLLVNSQRLSLNKPLFSRDALVLKHLESHSVRLMDKSGNSYWTFRFAGFPYLGLWAGKGGDFVCVEPWCGIADSVDATQLLTEKEGIQRINPGETWQRSWQLELEPSAH